MPVVWKGLKEVKVKPYAVLKYSVSQYECLVNKYVHVKTYQAMHLRLCTLCKLCLNKRIYLCVDG